MARKRKDKGEWQEKKMSEFNDTFTFAKKGDTLEGRYEGSHEITTGLGESTVHTLKTGQGLIDFFGSGQINWILKDVQVGTMVKIVYNGKVKAKVKAGKGGKKISKEVHNFRVYTK